MRCKNCGWENDPGADRCKMCGQPLQVENSYNGGGTYGESAPKATVIGASGMYEPEPKPTRLANSTDRQSVMSDIVIPDTVKCDKCGEEVSMEFSYCPKCGEKIRLKTMPAIRHKALPKIQKHCSLTLIPEEDEQMEEKKIDYEGSVIVLTRDNTESDNRTITSKEQAELRFSEGKWYVVNKSEYGSTYVEANREIEIQPGDIIVLGDRRFRFEAES